MSYRMKLILLLSLLLLAACSLRNTTNVPSTDENNPVNTLVPARLKVTVQEHQRADVGMNLKYPIRIVIWADANTVVASVPGRGIVRWPIAGSTLEDVYSEKGRDAVGVVAPGHLIARTFKRNHKQQTITDQQILWLQDGSTTPEYIWDVDILANNADHPQSIAYDQTTGILVPGKAGLMVLNTATGTTSTLTTTSEPQYIAVSVSGDIAYTTKDGQVCIVQRICTGTPGNVVALLWEPSGKRLLVTSVQSQMIWNASTSEASQYRIGHSGIAAWHPALPLIASVDNTNERGVVVIWESNTGKEIERINYNNQPFHALSWSPDGKYLVATGQGGTLVVWDVTASQE